MKSQNKHSVQYVKCPDNKASKSKAAYEPDDGLLTYEQLEAIKKLVPQKDFSSAKTLFD